VTEAFSVSTSVAAAATSTVSMTTSDESMTMVTASDHQFTTTDPTTETGTDTADSTAFIIIGTTAGVLVLSLTLIVIVVAFRALAQSSTAATAAALARTSYRRPRGPGPRGTRMLNLDRGRVPLYGDKKKSDTKNKFGRQKCDCGVKSDDLQMCYTSRCFYARPQYAGCSCNVYNRPQFYSSAPHRPVAARAYSNFGFGN